MGKQQAKQLWGAKERGILDFLYLYGPVVIFYMFSLVVWFLARFSLNKGIPRTYRVREQRIQQGKGTRRSRASGRAEALGGAGHPAGEAHPAGRAP